MTTGHVFIATSLDGFVAGPNHEPDWLTSIDTQGEDMGFTPFMASVDGLIITVAPILLGDGRRLFGELDGPIALDCVESTRFACGMVQSHYRVATP